MILENSCADKLVWYVVYQHDPYPVTGRSEYGAMNLKSSWTRVCAEGLLRERLPT